MNPRFALNFAPHLGILRPDRPLFLNHAGPDPIDQLKFIAGQGFRAVEDNNLLDRPADVQSRMGEEIARLGIQMGCFVVFGRERRPAPTFVRNDADMRAHILGQLDAGLEAAKRVGGRLITTVCGVPDPAVPWAYQFANTIDNLRFCAERAHSAGVTLIMEATNRRAMPGILVNSIKHAFLAVRSVASPALKLLFDVGHVQVEDGDLVKNMERCWDEIAYFQLADNPGRREPGSGEINFVNLLRRVHRKGYQGILGMEHLLSGEGRAGEEAVILAYEALSAAIT
ncbi:MAG TPA: TIM barrel protein [Candidatus Binataceae bacterium]|nr:TIM barrel protein [Candidatus Binataceae bacterium]